MSCSTYFDYNATAPMCKEAKDAVMGALDIFANPSATYRSAKQAKDILAYNREMVAALINAEPEQIFFTSGGTESNSWIINTVLSRLSHKATAVCSAIEHDAVLSALSERCVCSNRQLKLILPDTRGIVSANHIIQCTASKSGAFISLMLANNETGAVQPVSEIGQMRRNSDDFFHVDAVQAVGRIPVDVQTLGCDSMSLSAHKFGGPKGIGALYVRDVKKLRPWILGGGQERGFRSGTENILGVAGMGAAAKTALINLSDCFNILSEQRNRLLCGITKAGIAHTVNSPEPARCLPNTVNLSFTDVRAEALAAYLSFRYNIEVAIGSACSRNKKSHQSHVLKAMGLSQNRIKGAIRISFGKGTSARDIDYLVDSLLASIQHLNGISSAIANQRA